MDDSKSKYVAAKGTIAAKEERKSSYTTSEELNAVDIQMCCACRYICSTTRALSGPDCDFAALNSEKATFNLASRDSKRSCSTSSSRIVSRGIESLLFLAGRALWVKRNACSMKSCIQCLILSNVSKVSGMSLFCLRESGIGTGLPPNRKDVKLSRV